MVIEGGRDVANLILFGRPTMMEHNYIANTMNNFIGNLSHVGKQLTDTARSMFKNMDDSTAFQLARTAMKHLNTFVQQDIIYPIETVDMLQCAPNVMLPWIMSHPKLRSYAEEGVIDAYHGRFTPELDYSIRGWDDPRYAELYSGWVQTVYNEETGEYEDEFSQEILDYDPTDESMLPPLTDLEAADLLCVHELIDVAIAEKRDPTSIYDSALQP
nr:MAG TPA: hypothetical protein [Caudoviricetes sp.]